MTDNYLIDKNSKLFQKFLNKKAGQPAQPKVQERQQSPPPRDMEPPEPTKEEEPFDTFGTRDNTKLATMTMAVASNNIHMTVDDIEEAASMVAPEPRPEPREVNEELQKTDIQVQFETTLNPRKVETNFMKVEQAQEPVKPPIVQKPRERRNREFKGKKRERQDHRENNQSFTAQEQTYIAPVTNVAPPQRTIETYYVPQEQPRMKENIEANRSFSRHEPEEKRITSLNDDPDLKKKYDRLYEKYEELINNTQRQRREKQQQLSEKDAQVELIRQKYFELRSKQDSLETELQRVKEKLQLETMMRTKYQEQSKEFSFKLQEMEDMLQGNGSSLRKKSDEVAYWRNQNESLKAEVSSLQTTIQKFTDRCGYLQGHNKILEKDIANKEGLLDELRSNVNSLIQENTSAKDEIYKLTVRTYQNEQQMQVMRGDLMRRQQESTVPIQSMSLSMHQPPSSPVREPVKREERVERQEKRGRKREFARERAVTTKSQRNYQPHHEERPQQSYPQEPVQSRVQTHPASSKAARIRQLEGELQRILDMKGMTGRVRREKMEIERELESLMGGG